MIVSAQSLRAGTKRSSAMCFKILTKDHTVDSAHFKVNLDDLELPEYGRDYLAFSIRLIRELIKGEGCSRRSINFGFTPVGKARSSCKLLNPEAYWSRVCYVETNLGYFIINQAFINTAHVTYSRWD